MKKNKPADIRIKELPFSFEGRDYMLRCNFSVVADVQDEFNGNLMASIAGKSAYKSVTIWLAAMMNNYAERAGWEDYEPYTARQLGNLLSPNEVNVNKIMRLVTGALIVNPDAEGGSADAADQGEQIEGQEKN